MDSPDVFLLLLDFRSSPLQLPDGEVVRKRAVLWPCSPPPCDYRMHLWSYSMSACLHAEHRPGCMVWSTSSPGETCKSQKPLLFSRTEGSGSLPSGFPPLMALISSDILPLQGPIIAVLSGGSFSLLIKLILEGDFLQLCSMHLLFLLSNTGEGLLTASSCARRQKTKLSR